MRRQAASPEWSLIAFTLLTQAAAGAVITRTALRWLLDEDGIDDRTAAVPVLTLLMLSAGVLAALTHLGRLRAARRVLANLRSSWLSREALIGSVFGALVAVDAVTGPGIVEDVAAVLGLALILAIARIYMIRTVPAWNSWATPAAFLASAATLGALTVVIMLAAGGYSGPTSSAFRGVTFAVAAATATGLLVTLVHLRLLHRRGGVAALSAAIVRRELRTTLLFRVLLGVLGGGWVAAIGANATMSTPTPMIGMEAVALLIGEVLGRRLFYAPHRRVGL